jgi:hypothetical protein
MHRYRFSLLDGSLLYRSDQPCRALKTYQLEYRGNEVGVLLDERV